MDNGNKKIPMGTTVRITAKGYVGSVGRIYGRCSGSSLYNVECEKSASIWYGKPASRGLDLNMYPGEFEII
jgi:hypothetical protein